MPMIAFAAFIVVSHFPNAWATVEQRILQAVSGRRNRCRNAPQHHFHNSAVIVIDALVEEQSDFILAQIMVSLTI